MNIEKKRTIIDSLDHSKKYRIIFLIGLVIAALTIRLFILPYDVPFFNDSQAYFWYAIDTSILKNFPMGHSLTNNGWPILVSGIFQFVNSDNFLDYQNVQRTTGIFFSVVTIFPVYLLCTRFFKKSYSLLGVTLFVFEPRIIQNSSLGTPESLYIFLIAALLALFLSNNFKKIYLAFLIVGLVSLVRYEGLLMIIPLSVVFFIRFKTKKIQLLKYLICIGVLLLIVIPIAYVKTDTMGKDGFVSHIAAGPGYYQMSIEENSSALNNFVENGVYNLGKYLGWIQIPFYIAFVPLGILLFFKNIDYKKMTIIIAATMILIPAFYAYSRDFSETKYLFALFPIFSLVACFSFKKFFELSNQKNLIFLLIVTMIVISSIIFVDWKSIDNEHYRETFKIMSEISDKKMAISTDFGKYGGEITYIQWTRLHNVEDFPILRSNVPETPIKYVKLQYLDEDKEIKSEYIDKTKINTFDEYLILLKNQNISHLLIDEKNIVRLINDNLRKELVYVFHNEQEFPFLTKEYDSKENGYTYHLKLFKINYELLENIQIKD